MSMPALLALADGTLFHGEAVGAGGSTAGEVVFNTAMTGYQEILTDPSYAQQIVTSVGYWPRSSMPSLAPTALANAGVVSASTNARIAGPHSFSS